MNMPRCSGLVPCPQLGGEAVVAETLTEPLPHCLTVRVHLIGDQPTGVAEDAERPAPLLTMNVVAAQHRDVHPARVVCREE